MKDLWLYLRGFMSRRIAALNAFMGLIRKILEIALRKEIPWTSRSSFIFQSFFFLICYWWFLMSYFAIAIAPWGIKGLPPPGLAIAALALAAVIMTVSGDLSKAERKAERIIWIVIAFVLFFVESRAIHQDRAENDARQENFFMEQRSGFQGIADQASQNFKVTAGGLTTAIQEANGILKNTKGISANLLNMSGGNSYAYVFPEIIKKPRVTLYVTRAGGEILTAVNLRIVEVQRLAPNEDEDHAPPNPSHDIPIGTISPYGTIEVPLVLKPQLDAKTGIAEYAVLISEQNGFLRETLEFRQSRRDSTEFAYRLSVVRTKFSDKSGRPLSGDRYENENLVSVGWSDEWVTKPRLK
jgi:hypothetical protein